MPVMLLLFQGSTEQNVNDLLLALEARDLARVHAVMQGIPTVEAQLSTICARSTSTERRLRTPLIAASETGDLAIFSAILDAFFILSSRTNPDVGGHWVSSLLSSSDQSRTSRR